MISFIKNLIMTDNNLKNYMLWDGVHTWWFEGRFVTGKRPWKLMLSFLIFNTTNLISFSQTWLYAKTFPFIFGAILWLIVNICMLLAACTDPGMIPKHEDTLHT